MEQEFLQKLNVLIIENNPLDSRLLKSMLGKSAFGQFEADFVKTLKDAFDLLARQNYQVVLLDLNLDDSTGLDSLRNLHTHFPHIAIVVNTGSYKENTGLKAISSGAQDYLIKGKYKAYGLVKALYYAVERKRFEDELKQAYQNLKETQTQLMQIEKMNVIGGLASGIAHEVKNPLATILYGIEFLSTKITDPDEQIVFSLNSIKEATLRANDIIKDLLDFASVSNLNRQLEDINRVIEQALILTRHQCDKRKIKVAKNYGSDLPLTMIDKNRILQVVVDLMLNAMLAVECDGVITITTYQRLFSQADHAVFSMKEPSIKVGSSVVIVDIEDSGPGIEEEILTKVFDPFFTTRRTAGGVGLGLSVARTIMLTHEGVISLTNRASGGAIARIIFKV
jgi:signal transduction histidine kinase